MVKSGGYKTKTTNQLRHTHHFWIILKVLAAELLILSPAGIPHPRVQNSAHFTLQADVYNVHDFIQNRQTPLQRRQTLHNILYGIWSSYTINETIFDVLENQILMQELPITADTRFKTSVHLMSILTNWSYPSLLWWMAVVMLHWSSRRKPSRGIL